MPMLVVILAAVGSCAGALEGLEEKRPQAGATWLRVEVEDGDEAALIEQQLGIKPVLVRNRFFYFAEDDSSGRTLRELGYRPERVDSDDVVTRIVRIARKGSEAAVRDVGVQLILRERMEWIVSATPRQVRTLGRLGYKVSSLGRRELYPRQVHVEVADLDTVATVVARRIDVHNVARSEKGYVVYGAAFDQAIDDLRALGVRLTVDPDPPGVRR